MPPEEHLRRHGWQHAGSGRWVHPAYTLHVMVLDGDRFWEEYAGRMIGGGAVHYIEQYLVYMTAAQA